MWTFAGTVDAMSRSRCVRDELGVMGRVPGFVIRDVRPQAVDSFVVVLLFDDSPSPGEVFA